MAKAAFMLKDKLLKDEKAEGATKIREHIEKETTVKQEYSIIFSNAFRSIKQALYDMVDSKEINTASFHIKQLPPTVKVEQP
jgi:hypothetical protein